MESAAVAFIEALIENEANRNIRKGLSMAKNILSSSGCITLRDLGEMTEEEKLQTAKDLAGM